MAGDPALCAKFVHSRIRMVVLRIRMVVLRVRMALGSEFEN